MLTPNRAIALIFVLTITVNGIFSQKITYSPYSQFGIGEMAKNGFARNQSMGGIALGLNASSHINHLNPASGSMQDTMSFIFTTGIAGNSNTLSSNNGTHSITSATLSHIAIAFPITKRLKTNIGVTPFSVMGYNLYDENINDKLTHYFEGEGGINQFFIGTGYRITENLSAGINFSYLFGSLSQTRSIRFHDPHIFNPQSISKTVVGDMHLRYGLQYSNRLSNDFHYTLGLIFENKTNINAKRDLLSYNELHTIYGTVRDTVQFFSAADSYIVLPQNLGVGISFGKENKFLAGADFTYRSWSETSFTEQQRDSLVNSFSINVGGEYIPDFNDFRYYLNRVSYRFGVHYTKSYLQIGGQDINDYGVTLGFGMPYGNGKSTFNLSVDIGRRGTKEHNLVQENYVMFNASLSLYDFWFFKRRFE